MFPCMQYLNKKFKLGGGGGG
eukprot:SAG11_NODE_4148_length_2041_cov_1.527806_1_plen_20_part_10